jgi:hypothetical protein
MTKISCGKGEYVLVEIQDADKMKSACKDVYEVLLESTAFVNHRLLTIGSQPLLMLAF